MARILHISCDFPDALSANKTQAVKRLIDGAKSHDHTVYSLNRVAGLSGVELLPFAERRFSVAYRAPPKGILLKSCLTRVAQCILSDVRRKGSIFDLVHAHKLTIDGIVGHQLAAALDVPITFSVQGDTDFKVISARPDLIGLFRRHVADASHMFCFAPWSLNRLKKKFPGNAQKISMLPVVPGQDELSEAPPTGRPHLVSVFHLDSWRRKNLSGMAQAVVIAAQHVPGIRLDIFGGGTPRSFLEAREAVRAAGAEMLVNFKGPISNDTVASVLKDYAAFVLPPWRESYGLVHVEALFAGLPILIARDMGIDGLLPPRDFIAPCEPGSPQAIAQAMVRLLNAETHCKALLGEAQRVGFLDKLRQKAIHDAYGKGLALALHKPDLASLELETAQ